MSIANPVGFTTSMQATGTCQTSQADFDMNIEIAGDFGGGCEFWYHYQWNP